MTQQRTSTLPNNTPIPLPPLSPPPQSHPQAINNSPLPVAYSLKLPQEVIKTLLAAPSAPSVRFDTNSGGQILINNANPIRFSIHPVADPNASTARAACYTRRNNSLRPVGPIIADLVVERTLSSSVAAATKKRALDARNAGKTRDLMVLDDVPAPHPAKKQRKKPPEKRPRAPRRPTNTISASVPPPKKPTPPLSNGVRLPRSSPVPPANISPPFRSPAVSPGHSAAKPNGSTGSTPTRKSFSAMPSRKVSPSSLLSLPKPVSRRTPTKPNRYSPVGSRGPSPSVNSPGSPRASSIRPPRLTDQTDITEIRRQIIHFLAMGEKDLKSIKDRLDSQRVEAPSSTLAAILAEVASSNSGRYALKEKIWDSVTESFDYTNAELGKMRAYRTEALEGPYDKLKKQNMSDAELDAAIESFRKNHKDTEEIITTEKQEAQLRKSFTKMCPLYSELIGRMEELQGVFKKLETRFLAAKSKDERDGLARRITNNHKKYRARYMTCKRVLPEVHSRMKRIRRALDEYAQSEDDR